MTMHSTLSNTTQEASFFYYVYHNGDKYPEQTPAQTSTPTGPTTYIDKSFTQDDFKVVNAGSATATVKQVSGCTFSNINIATSEYMFGANGAFSFFNKVFQNDDNTERSCPLKVYNLKSILNFVISRCKFTKIVSKANVNGNILYTTLPIGTGTAATAFATHITFEFCEFTDCPSSKDQTLVYLANIIDTASFTNCKFIFSDAVGEGS
ncbi:hypothetical protein M9Y10_006358 [Tritrichomonas musculus]|uniref:Uncharacterized protein n=1 Tax=Tritrichomonas musculus TaxID=1915356 RepID=A0ABR2JE07_9EUKA